MILINHPSAVLFITGLLLLVYGLIVPVPQHKPDNRDVYSVAIGLVLLVLGLLL